MINSFYEDTTDIKIGIITHFINGDNSSKFDRICYEFFNDYNPLHFSDNISIKCVNTTIIWVIDITFENDSYGEFLEKLHHSIHKNYFITELTTNYFSHCTINIIVQSALSDEQSVLLRELIFECLTGVIWEKRPIWKTHLSPLTR